jgi:hypothetical protein
MVVLYFLSCAARKAHVTINPQRLTQHLFDDVSDDQNERTLCLIRQRYGLPTRAAVFATANCMPSGRCGSCYHDKTPSRRRWGHERPMQAVRLAHLRSYPAEAGTP